MMALRVITLDEIQTVADKTLILNGVRAALIAHAECRTQVPPPTHLRLDEANGECHVPAGAILRDGCDRRGTLSIADLTGVGAVDAAVSSAVLERLLGS